MKLPHCDKLKSSLSLDVPLYFVVRAYNQGGSSGYSNESSSTPTAFTPLNPTLFVKNVEYNASGQVLSIEYGNGDIKTYTYNAFTLRVERIYTVNGVGVDLQDLNYTYDSVGNILTITDNVNTASQTFQYDELNRLVDANGSQYGQKNYVYDEVGNIVEKDGNVYSYAEGGAGVHAVTSLSDGTTFTYDANGNMFTKQLSDGTLTQFTYDPENRLTKVVKDSATIAEYTYDGDGGRTSKVADGIKTTFVGSLYEETVLTQTKSIFLGSTRIASVVDGKVLYYHGDHLGGTNVVTNDVGDIKDLIEYLPFGGESRREKSYDNPEQQARYTFTNHYKDDETGLIFMQARYYDPSLGRFITPDTIVQDPGNPQTLNRYTYVNNNPVNNIDPSGHGWFRKLFKIFNKVFLPLIPDKYKGVVIGAAVTLVAGPVWGALASSAYNTLLYEGSWGDFGRSFGIGILTAGIGAGIGDVVGGSLGGFIGAAASGAVAGGVGSTLTGGSFGAGAGQGAIFAAAGYLAVTGAQAAVSKIKSARLAEAAGEGNVGTVDILKSVNSTNSLEEFTSGVDAYVHLNGKEASDIHLRMARSFSSNSSPNRNWGMIGQGILELGVSVGIGALSVGAAPVSGGFSALGLSSAAVTFAAGLHDILSGFAGGTQTYGIQVNNAINAIPNPVTRTYMNIRTWPPLP